MIDLVSRSSCFTRMAGYLGIEYLLRVPGISMYVWLIVLHAKRVWTGKPKKLLGHAVLVRSVKTVVQSGLKPRCAFVGPCWPKLGPYI